MNATSCRSFFGVGPAHCEIVWNLICHQQSVNDLQPQHMLFGLLFLKLYSTEEIHSHLFRVTRTTFRTLSWRAVHVMAELKVVRNLQN